MKVDHVCTHWQIWHLIQSNILTILQGKTVSLKLKTVDFQVRTRAHTLSSYTNDSETIFSVAKSILQTEIQAELPKILRLRLMGKILVLFSGILLSVMLDNYML